jgi:CDP-glycerol:poly(glycerophosphate) glycerophosphotransferase
MQEKHKRLITNLLSNKKKRTKVVFLVFHKSVWKVDSVFQLMQEDPFFEPIILVCPYIAFGRERMLEDLATTYSYFRERNYPVLNSYDVKHDKWVELDDLKPDLLFFTNPHNLTRPEYYDLAYKKFLTCYVPYFYLVLTYGNDQPLYNLSFHNAMWKIFLPHKNSLETAERVSSSKATNCFLTGYPACEQLVSSAGLSNKTIWKAQETEKLKIIWAPHHTIDSPELQMSNFLVYADLFKSLALKYFDKVQWAFKPHPILKSKLYFHKNWGKEKTEEYYSFWESTANTQLEMGGYDELFLQSDALVHDCNSFLAEYLYLKKPVLYLMESNEIRSSLNDFGNKALDVCNLAHNILEVECFIKDMITGKNLIHDNHDQFLNEEVRPFYANTKPSREIVKLIKEGFIN